ncbi:MAG: biotin--[acetyl-CoA-carboxylase] ligase [Burkholderiales bacterium]|jgi:BirA family biotin operon repressor/biotin-[acetyl-CoA-carboxylase] ligase
MSISVIALLRLLSDGRAHSTNEIARTLGVSFAAVSAALEDLRTAGFELEEQGHAGCKLITPFSALNALQIERRLGQQAGIFCLDIVDQTGSTNEDLMSRARAGARSGLVRVAEVQTAGRGRRQRKWFSAPGGTLTFSLLWRFDAGPAAISGLPLAVGVSIVRTMGKLGLQGVQLKWPNDVLWQQRKLGGILIETTAGHAQGLAAVIGIGLNLRLPPGVAERIDQPAVDLAGAGLQIGRNELLACLLSDLDEMLGQFSRDGFSAFRQQWERAHAYQDKIVTIQSSNGAQLAGKVIGVDENGALLLHTTDGTRLFLSGEVSLRAGVN